MRLCYKGELPDMLIRPCMFSFGQFSSSTAAGLGRRGWLIAWWSLIGALAVAGSGGTGGVSPTGRQPVAVVLRTLAGRRLHGTIVAYDGEGFQLRSDGADDATSRIAWAELSAGDVFGVHERLLTSATAADWRAVAKLLRGMEGGKPYAQTASRLAAELSARDDEGRQRRQRKSATGGRREARPPRLDGKPMVSVLSRPPAGASARRLIRALKLHWKRRRAGQSRTEKPQGGAARPWCVEFDPPAQVRVEEGRASVVGAVRRFDQAGFALRLPNGRSRVVRWQDLEPDTVLAVFGQLLAEGTGEQWLRAARLVASLEDGRLEANTTLRLALERDPSLGDLPDFDRIHVHAYAAERCGEAITCPDLGRDAAPYWRRTRERVEQAAGRRKLLYRVVGEHLLLADRYLARDGRAARLEGMGYAHDATYVAIRRLDDPLLGLAIADFFLLPHLDAAERLYTKPLSRQSIVNTAVAAYDAAGDSPRLVHALERLLATAHNRNAADAARYRLAHFLARQGGYEAALRHLEQIEPPQGQSGPGALLKAVKTKLAEQQAPKPRPAP